MNPDEMRMELISDTAKRFSKDLKGRSPMIGAISMGQYLSRDVIYLKRCIKGRRETVNKYLFLGKKIEFLVSDHYSGQIRSRRDATKIKSLGVD